MKKKIERALAPTSIGQVHYLKSGTGAPVLLLHINQQSSMLYQEMMEAFAPGFRCIAPDYPSYGFSDPFETAPEVRDFARVMIELMDHLGIEKFNIIGEAFGTLLASELARSHPDRVARMLFLNCPFTPEDDRSADVTQAQRPVDADGFPMTRTLQFVLANDAMHAPMKPTQSWMDRVNKSNVLAGRNRRHALDALWRYDFASSLRAIKCPVEVLVGEHFYYAKYAGALSEHLGGAPVRIQPGARFCLGWERAAEVAAHAAGFFSRGATSAD
jgi:pimeloyl-ACP methyl ester carboxylesterase